jgi:hypothetical protein
MIEAAEGRDLAAPKIIEDLIGKFNNDPAFYRFGYELRWI